jgi:ubiquinone/menaquinone biosynthesis C-methylase UbiE
MDDSEGHKRDEAEPRQAAYEIIEDTAGFYNRLANDYDRVFAYSSITTRVQATWLGLKLSKGLVLDLGCGTGRMIPPLTQKGFKVVGLDCADQMLSIARCRLPKAALVYGDACQALPFGDNSFDHVISLHASIIHATSWERLMTLSQEVHRILKPGGCFVVEMPHHSTYPEPEQTAKWSPFQPGVDCRSHDHHLREVRLTQFNNLTTRVRSMDMADLEAWLNRYSDLKVYDNYSHIMADPLQGEVMVMLAKK